MPAGYCVLPEFFKEGGNAMNYKSITSATGWYFRDDMAKVVWQLAVWAMTESGEIIGLIALKNTDGSPKLVCIPSAAGRYLHRDQLTEEEFEVSKKSK